MRKHLQDAAALAAILIASSTHLCGFLAAREPDAIDLDELKNGTWHRGGSLSQQGREAAQGVVVIARAVSVGSNLLHPALCHAPRAG